MAMLVSVDCISSELSHCFRIMHKYFSWTHFELVGNNVTDNVVRVQYYCCCDVL